MSLNKSELKQLCQIATSAAILAGQYIQSQFHSTYDKEHKETGDSLASQLVTAIDRQAQDIIISQLQSSIQEYDLGILTEEAADDHSRTEKAFFWCIDPMDGTLPFTERKTGYAVSIALVSKAGDPVIGVVYIPDLAASYTSIKGEGVLLNDSPFERPEAAEDELMHVFMDRSLASEPYFGFLIGQLAKRADIQIKYHADFGAVRNALGVMHSDVSCYFKFPKNTHGGGCIWDYAATRLFFEELGLYVSNASGDRLALNDPITPFMNISGVLYATHRELFDYIIALGLQINK
jgi:fructose-1,6-bisphosphatase/inositol monophosphatase family enzyme